MLAMPWVTMDLLDSFSFSVHYCFALESKHYTLAFGEGVNAHLHDVTLLHVLTYLRHYSFCFDPIKAIFLFNQD